MKKPEFYKQKCRIINMLDLLDYVDLKVKGFRNKAWEYMCEYYNIQNNTYIGFYFAQFLDSDEDDLVDGTEFLLEEFPEIDKDDILFEIFW
ncbi:MAG: hypothetical protein ACRCTZ_03815 [Sarcina sp.]